MTADIIQNKAYNLKYLFNGTAEVKLYTRQSEDRWQRMSEHT